MPEREVDGLESGVVPKKLPTPPRALEANIDQATRAEGQMIRPIRGLVAAVVHWRFASPGFFG